MSIAKLNVLIIDEMLSRVRAANEPVFIGDITYYLAIPGYTLYRTWSTVGTNGHLPAGEFGQATLASDLSRVTNHV